MGPCRHESLEFIGEQTTDEGVNSYYRCKLCGDLLVMTPARTVFEVKGAQKLDHPPGSP